MISLYRSGNSILHRMPVGPKLLGLFISLFAVSVWGRNLVGALTVVVGFLALFALAGFGVKDLLKQLWQMKVLLLIVVFVASILLAGLVTLTTKTSDIVALVEKLTRSQAFAFLIALSINSIALVLGFSKSITEAGLARGVKRNPVGQIVTLFVVSLRFADDYAEALQARGVRV
jgi:biotin transport system permease protein